MSNTLDPMVYRLHGIIQARILERVAFPFSRGSSQPRDRIQVSCLVGRFFTKPLLKKLEHVREGGTYLADVVVSAWKVS